MRRNRILVDDNSNAGNASLPGQPGPPGEPGVSGQAGADGKNIELQTSATHIQWRKSGDSSWTNLVALADLKGSKGDKGDVGNTGQIGQTGQTGSPGTDGKSVELNVSATHIQWRQTGSTTWLNLVPLADLKGAKGDAGSKGDVGATGAMPTIKVSQPTAAYTAVQNFEYIITQFGVTLPNTLKGPIWVKNTATLVGLSIGGTGLVNLSLLAGSTMQFVKDDAGNWQRI
jgi:hypothetical protein